MSANPADGIPGRATEEWKDGPTHGEVAERKPICTGSLVRGDSIRRLPAGAARRA